MKATAFELAQLLLLFKVLDKVLERETKMSQIKKLLIIFAIALSPAVGFCDSDQSAIQLKLEKFSNKYLTYKIQSVQLKVNPDSSTAELQYNGFLQASTKVRFGSENLDLMLKWDF